MPLSATPTEDQQQLAAQVLEQDAHFVKALTDTANKREIIASEDIYSSSGMKLVSSGTRLTGAFYDRLVEHKLLKPIEQSLSMKDSVDAARLMSLINAEGDSIAALAPLFRQPESIRHLERTFGELRIPAALALKLTVAQEQRPILFQHLLNTAMLAYLVATQDKLPAADAKALLLAAVFHDLGELSIDPAILTPEHRMTPDDRRHIYAHPLTGFLILRDFPAIPTSAAQAVLQHHERIDASGYPRRLPGTEIGFLARYLAVIDVAATLLVRFGADKRINMLLRLNRKKYDDHAVSSIGRIFRAVDTLAASAPDEAFAMTRLVQTGQIFETWALLRNALEQLSASESATVGFIVKRMDNLRLTVVEVGFDPSRFEDMLSLACGDDPDVRMELTLLLDELDWQFRALSREIERTLFGQELLLPAAAKEIFDTWLAQVRQLVGE